jgi:site-specific DNA-cytosine methylase
MNKHAVFSFFSGTEFLDLGFEDAGFDVAFFTRTDLIPA